MDKITTVGIDLAKRVFALHAVDVSGRVVLRKTLRREQLLEFVSKLPPCRIGMEAGSGAHAWARQFQSLGHEVGIMAAKFVAPYRKNAKNDGNDAEAICEARSRPSMRFVPIKSEEQQALLSLHRVRQGFIQERTATINRIRGLLSEFGIVLAQKAATVRREAAAHLEDLPGWANTAVGDSLSELHRLDERITEYDRHVVHMAREDERSRALMQLSGIGSTTASALVSTIGNARDFKNGRQLAAWLGLVPGQYSSGGKTRLGGITKAGDGYLRTLLVLGAKSVLAAARNKHDRLSRWAMALEVRRGYWKAVVAIAAKNARMAWAVLAKGETFKPLEA